MKVKEVQKMIKIYNQRNSKYKFDFISGWKPAKYFLPCIAFSTKHALEQREDLAWFCEIFVNNKCIYRECAPPNDKQTEKELEQRVLDNLVETVFLHGIVLQYEYFLTIDTKRF